MTNTILTPQTTVRVGRQSYTLTQSAAAELNATATKTSKTYLLKAACPECDYTIRITRKHINKAGTPCCPACSDYDTGYIVPLLLDNK